MKQISKNFFWNAAGNTAYNGLQWLITVIVARVSGLDGAGILSIAMSLSLTFRTIAYFGIRNFQVSDENNKYSFEDYTGLRIITCSISLAACMIFAVLSGYSATVNTAIFWYMIFRISEGFSDLFQGWMQKNGRLDIAGASLTAKAVITAAAFAVVFFPTNSLNLALFAMAISSVAEILLLELPLTIRVCRIKAGIRWIRCRELALETAPLLIHLLLVSVTLNMPKYALSLTCDDACLGAYSSIFSVSQIIQAVFQYMYTPFVTEFSKLYSVGKTAEIKMLAKKILFVFVLLLLFFTAAMQLFGMPVLVLVFGGEIEQYKYMILPAIISVCAYCIMTFVCTLETIMRNFRVMILGQFMGTAAGVICTYIFIKIFGTNGASYGMSVAAAVSSAVMLGYKMCKTNESYGDP